ncbi:hypothetical protein [Clavibacter sp. Sh2088]|uniref:hypothetical protein n=1 Tax=Clavibacter sp. Sh2088 TaxID=3397676 RepID=UPI0039DFC3FC
MTFQDQSERIAALESGIGAALDALKARDATKDAGEKKSHIAEYRQHLYTVTAIVDRQADDDLGETWYLLIWSNKKRPKELATDLGRHKAVQPPHYRKSQLMY